MRVDNDDALTIISVGAQGFLNGPWDTGQGVNLSGGYPAELAPNQRAGRMMIRDLQRHGVSGQYTVLYDGDGVLGFGMDVQRVWRPQPGQVNVWIELSTVMNNGLFLTVERTNPLDPVRNIRVFTPGFGKNRTSSVSAGYRGTPFHPAFIETLRRYRVLRFMEWQATNGIGAGRWTQRPKRSDASYVTGGPPLEDMLLLSNVIGADAYLCIPHLADDDYVRQFAQMVHDMLRPDRKVYIEYSNELWHTGFPGGQYADAQGAVTGLGRFCYTVARLRNISRIFQSVYGPAGRQRFTIVVSSQTVNADATQQILACNIGTAGVDIDAVVLGPYFDGFSATITQVNDMIASFDAGINASLKMVAAHAAITRPRGFQLLTYEAGPGSPVGSNNDLAIATQRDSRMRSLVRRYYSGLAAVGVGLLLHYVSTAMPSKYGSFGLLESTDQDPATAPKLQGLNDLMEARAVCLLPNATLSDHGACGGHGYYSAGIGGGIGCFCYYGYGGEYCDKAQYTEHTSACGYFCTFDQGVCAPVSISGFERYWGCKCGLGYWGTSCSRFTCAAPCLHGGTCIDQDVCSCFPGFTGRSCEVDCGCNGHGVCDAKGTSCLCDEGWRLGASGVCEWACNCPGNQPCSGPGTCPCAGCIYGSCIRGQCHCWAGYAGERCDQAAPRPSDESPVGMNLAGVGYGLEWIFVDVMKHSSGWVSVPGSDTANTSSQQYIWGDGEPVYEDDSGYLVSVGEVQEVVTLTLRDLCLHGTAGRYVVLYDGDGFLDFGMDASVMVRRRGRIDVAFTPTCNPSCWFDSPGWQAYCSDNGFYIRVLQTSPSNPLRNIRIITPGFLDRYC